MPLQRLSRVVAIANVAVFLASELGSLVTGLYILVLTVKLWSEMTDMPRREGM
jgi:hypothetical protein